MNRIKPKLEFILFGKHTNCAFKNIRFKKWDATQYSLLCVVTLVYFAYALSDDLNSGVFMKPISHTYLDCSLIYF